MWLFMMGNYDACAAAVKLHSLSIKASGPAAPRTVKLFTNRPSLGFSEAADFPPLQEFTLDEANLDGTAIQLKCAACLSLHAAPQLACRTAAGHVKCTLHGVAVKYACNAQTAGGPCARSC